MASHILIDTHLAQLHARLPADTVDELADGLTETYRRQLNSGLDPDTAARAAIAEFGDPATITTAFVQQAPARRMALTLLGTGPVVGGCWGLSLLVGHAWNWPIPIPARIAFGLALASVIAILGSAVLNRHNYRNIRLAATSGSLALIVLDATMLTAALLLAPALVWPMALAIPASLTRIGLTMRALHHVIAQ
jgi:hypothetical protein